MTTVLRHIALFVPDLQAAETFYQRLFNMEIVGREAQLENGLWYALPAGKGWDDARAAGVELGMIALAQGAFVLALFPGAPQPGQLYMIGLSMSPEEIAGVRERLPEDEMVLEDRPGTLTFRDRHLIGWQIYTTGAEYRNSGESGDRWLDV
jgi:catechol 2,3-dioxygenase-like lactoylglutathione lyase family enzyme